MRQFRLVFVDRKTGEPTFEGERVHRGLPCPICSHLHRNQSWCVVDTARGLVICPRVQSKVAMGMAGWLHTIDGSDARITGLRRARPDADLRIPDMTSYIARFRNGPGADEAFDLLAAEWGVSREVFRALRPGWDGKRSRYLFPMYDWNDKGEFVVCGVRTRCSTTKRKAAVTGSRNGLFVPRGESVADPKRDLYIVEGESDLAAAVQLGLQAIGRPGCLAVERSAVRYARACNTVIVRDNDGPGRDGAERLASLLVRAKAKSVVVIAPPPKFKDLREWSRVCAGPAVIEAVTRGKRGY